MADRDFIQEFGILNIRVEKAFKEILLHDDLSSEEKILGVLEKLKETEDYLNRIKREIILQRAENSTPQDLAFYSGYSLEKVAAIIRDK